MYLTCKENMLPEGTLLEKCLMAKQAGFDGIDWMGGALRSRLDEAKKALRETGLAVGAVYGQLGQKGSSLIEATAAERASVLDLFKERLEAAAEVGAGRLIFVPRFGDAELKPEAADGVLLAMLDELAEWASDLPVALVMEPLNRKESRYLHDPLRALELCRTLGRPNVRTMIDTYHMAEEKQDIAGAIGRLPPYLGLAHLSDTGRGLPGEGGIDFGDVLRAFHAAGYDGPLGYECREAGPAELKRSVDWVRELAPDLWTEPNGTRL
ncbi:sugar phosphate isomerase/epimerase family protein [Cohnella zeiphila]|uniref:Sugar phosphate isomerase/epimerase n=1 Tax=Cohnella zeiphila TaxID=2761120 RepID=A0A7X0SP67_9BACL|nr:sugar phosphate isomerase/epimerase [Cohnella zeiphila]MBB6732330.1 sugar phosphate isomerase/epimerase [Cohnella zeiphila]